MIFDSTRLAKLAGLHQKQPLKEELSLISEGPVTGANTIRFEFERSKSDIDPKYVLGDVDETVSNLLDAIYGIGMHSERPITVRAGTSGSGTPAQNKVVRDRRINAAFEYLANLANAHRLLLPPEHRALPLAPASLWNLSNVHNVVDKIEPGQSIPDPDVHGVIRTAPKDPDSPWHGKKQFIEITIEEPKKAPDEIDTVTLASEFVEATLRTTGPVYADTPAGQLKVSNAVADILSQLRNADEFEEFNNNVIKVNLSGKDFYGIAATVTLNVPKWVPKLGGLSVGPKEIPAGVTEINRELVRLGQEPIV